VHLQCTYSALSTVGALHVLQAWARERSPQMDRLAAIVKHTGQESRGKLCENVKV